MVNRKISTRNKKLSYYTTEIAIMWGHYAFQGQARSLVFIIIKSAYWLPKFITFYIVVINTITCILSCTVSKLLQIIGQSSLSTGGTSLWHNRSVFFWGGEEPLNSGDTITKFDLKKLETSLYRMVQNGFRYLEPFRRGSRVWRTDRQTDRQTGRP